MTVLKKKREEKSQYHKADIKTSHSIDFSSELTQTIMQKHSNGEQWN